MPNVTGRGNTLLDGMAESCVLLDRAVIADGLGGFKEVYSEGVEFDAVIRKDDTSQDRIAEKQGVQESYTVIVMRGFPLKNTDVFRRQKDGKTYRVRSNIMDKEAPMASTIKIGAVTAERWDVPNA